MVSQNLAVRDHILCYCYAQLEDMVRIFDTVDSRLTFPQYRVINLRDPDEPLASKNTSKTSM